MMIQAMISWPDKVNMNLWSFTIYYSAYLWNKIPRGKATMSLEELFCYVKIDHKVLQSAKVLGYPTYVLDPIVQYGKNIP